MCDSACRWFIVENGQIKKVVLNMFEFFHMKEIVES